MKDHKLICTVGLPRSGKTTWSQSMKVPNVNLDAIRLATYGQRFNHELDHLIAPLALTMIKSLFLAGHEIVILDDAGATLTKEQRDYWKYKDSQSFGTKLNEPIVKWKTLFKYFDISKGECIRRSGDDSRIIDTINDMVNIIQEPDPSESEFDINIIERI